MRLVLSPYEFDSASPAAAAAMLLGRDEGGVLTIQPTPFGNSGPDAAREAATLAPAYARLLEKWRWTGPLWRGGVLQAAGSGQSLATMLSRSAAALLADRSLIAARGLLKVGPSDDESAFLESLSRDLIRGGSDPAISLPLVAVTERLAAEADAALVCGQLGGMIWKPRPGAPTSFTFSIPLILGATGGEILDTRAALADSLETFRNVLREALMAARLGQVNGHAGAVRLAAEAFAREFRSIRSSRRPDAHRDSADRPVEAVFSVSIVPTGRAVREAVARLSRMIPAPRASAASSSVEATIVPRERSIALMRVRLAAWDFAPPIPAR
jgi:hypothetical protein